MKSVLLLVLCCWTIQLVKANNVDNAIGVVGAVTNIFGQILSNFLATNCTDIKALFGVQYYQLNTYNKPDLSKVTINLCTTDHTVTYNLSNGANMILADPGFNPSLPVTIFVHGFFTSMDNPSILTMTSSLLKRAKSNVMFIDASSVIYFFYMKASTCVQFIGELLGAQMAGLLAGGVNPSNIHLIGHSLGSHISGFAGKTFRALTGTALGRISGLDPAGPCFFIDTPNHTLASTDASFVDVIHTNAGVYGIIKPLGHVDFYPNGGANQPGSVTPYTAHNRVWQFFAESLLHETNFLAVKCSNWTTFLSGACTSNEQTTMGVATPPTTRGIFYLKTGGYSPYGMGATGTIANPTVSPIDAIIAWWNSLFGIK